MSRFCFKHALAVLLGGLALMSLRPAQAALVTQEIAYSHDGVPLVGYLAYDNALTGPLPGVVVIHEWWGQTGYARKRAEQLAGLGYAAFAADMYGERKLAETPTEAAQMSKPFYAARSLMQGRAGAALQALAAQPQVDPAQIAAVGYCFGGTVALEMARAGMPLKGVVSFHGGLDTPAPAQAGVVKAEVLALNGKADEMVTEKQRQDFEREMKAANVAYASIDYAGAKHAFTNPEATELGKKFGMPVSYNEEADKASWEEMRKFLARVLQRQPAP